jgi:hypothetical protein
VAAGAAGPRVMTRCAWTDTIDDDSLIQDKTRCSEPATEFFRGMGGWCWAWCKKHGCEDEKTVAFRTRITEQEFLTWQLVRQVQES